jgi:hypothetical protein
MGVGGLKLGVMVIATASLTSGVACKGVLNSVVAGTFRLSLSQASLTLNYLGQTANVSATAEDMAGEPIPDVEVAWTTRDAAIVTVSDAGQVTAQGEGSTFVVASALGSEPDSLVVTVLVSAALDVSPASVFLSVPGATADLLGLARDAAGDTISDAEITWTSRNPEVATVSASGRVTAVAFGFAVVVASSPCCSSDSATVAVVESQLPPGTLLAVNWGTATGNSVAAVGDGGKGVMRWCNWPEVLNVAPGNTVGWSRTANVLSVRSIQNCGHVEFPNLFPLPTDGQQQYWAVRYYVMNGIGQTDTKQHPHCFWPVGAIEIVHTGISALNANGDWNHRLEVGVTHFPMSGASRRVLTGGTWYRYEFIMHWVNATQFRIYPRLYDMAGNLLNDYTTWEHEDGVYTLQEYYAAGNYFTRRSDSGDPNNIRDLSFGMGQAGRSNQYYYVADAAFALVTSASDFIGQ